MKLANVIYLSPLKRTVLRSKAELSLETPLFKTAFITVSSLKSTEMMFCLASF